MENTDPIKEKSRNARKPAKDSRKRGGQHEGAILRRAQRGAHGSFVGPAQARWPWRGPLFSCHWSKPQGGEGRQRAEWLHWASERERRARSMGTWGRKRPG